MLNEHVFAREEVLPSWWANKVGNFLSLSAAGFQITLASPTTIEVVAGADEAAAIIAVAGSWRWVEATVSRAHPGGGAGTYDIYVTAKATDITSTPVVFTDATDYAWDLAIVAHGATPLIVAGVVDIFRKVGELQWDGAAITLINQMVPATARHSHTHAAGQPDAIAPADIGAVATGSAGTLASLHLTGAGAALAVDHDATVGGTLAVTGTSTLAGLVTVRAGLSLDAGAGTAGQTLTLTGRSGGAAVSSTLAVSSVGALTVTSGTSALVGATSGGTAFTSSTAAFNIPGQYQVGGTQIALGNLSNATTGTGTTVVLSASPTFTGTTTIATAAVTTFSGTPNFSGAATGQTATVGDNTTKLATTAFVQANSTTTKYARVSANVAATLTMANVTGLSFAIGANEKWVVEFILFSSVSGGTSNGGFSAQLTGPASPTSVQLGLSYPPFSLGADGLATAFSSAATTSLIGTGGPAVMRVWALIENGVNAGTVQLQFAVTSTGVWTANAGSYMVATKVG